MQHEGRGPLKRKFNGIDGCIYTEQVTLDNIKLIQVSALLYIVHRTVSVLAAWISYISQ